MTIVPSVINNTHITGVSGQTNKGKQYMQRQQDAYPFNSMGLLMLLLHTRP
jgi:hypothetical protein